MSQSLYGVDIASRRMDDLDRMILEEVSDNRGVKVLDLGCGELGHSLRLAAAGSKVTAVDIKPPLNIEAIDDSDINFIQSDIRQLNSDLLDNTNFDFGYCQRTLHYLTYDEAEKLLQFLRQIITNKLFISVTGIDTSAAERYRGHNVNIPKRFFKLTLQVQETHQINQPVCLYNQEEFITLLASSGWEVESIWPSAFGNLKVVAKPQL